MNRPTLVIIIAAVFALGACGKVGALDRPAPLYGAKAKAQYQADKAAAAAAKAQKDDNGEPETLPRDARADDPTLDTSPPRSRPIEGSHPLPSGAPPPGVLPDPFNHPQ